MRTYFFVHIMTVLLSIPSSFWNTCLFHFTKTSGHVVAYKRLFQFKQISHLNLIIWRTFMFLSGFFFRHHYYNHLFYVGLNRCVTKKNCILFFFIFRAYYCLHSLYKKSYTFVSWTIFSSTPSQISSPVLSHCRPLITKQLRGTHKRTI